MLLEKLRNKNRIWFMSYVGIHIIFLIWLIAMNLIQYETIDDFYQLTYFSGMFGNYSPFVMFSNVIYGGIMCLLFRLLPICNWMVVGYVAIIFISMVAIARISIYKIPSKIFAFSINLVFLLSTYSYLYEQLNFTKVAMISLAAGVVLLIDVLADLEAKNKVEMALAVVLIAWGSMLRFKVAAMVLAFLAIIFIEDIISKQISKKKIVCISIVLLAVLIPWGVNKIAYSSKGWSEANYRFELLNGAVDYGTLPEEMWDKVDWEDIGFDQEDMVFCLGWHFSDKNVFSVDSLKRMTKYEHKIEINPGSLIKAGKESFKYCASHILFWISFITILLAFIFNKKKRVETIGVLVIMLLETYYLVLNNRYPDRVGIIAWVAAFAISIYYFAAGYNSDKKYNKYIAAVLLIASLIITVSDGHLAKSKRFVSELNNPKDFSDFIQNVDNIKSEDLFLINYTNPILDAYGIFECPDRGILNNCVLDTGCMSLFPDVYDKCDKFGSSNSPYEAIVANDHTYIIDERYLYEKRQFIRKHYDESVDYSLVYSNGREDAYAFTPKIEIDNLSMDVKGIITTTEDLDSRDDFYLLKGVVENANPESTYFIDVYTDAGKNYCYQIRVENDEFTVGIPKDTWIDSESLRVGIMEKTSKGEVQEGYSSTEVSL